LLRRAEEIGFSAKSLATPFSDSSAIEIRFDDFHSGALRVTSFARPSKLFTANQALISAVVGDLELDKFDEILDAVIALFQASKQP
jgi:mRNA interferase MazF